MEALEDLKAIIAGKPEGATHISDNGVFYKLDGYTPLTWWVRGKEWIDSGVHHITRSLSDIERIIELMELNQNMHTTVAGYIYGKDWAHWNEFNAGKFKL